MKSGFGVKKTQTRTTRFWVSRYEQGNDDEPLSVERVAICYEPGQEKEKKMLQHCHGIFKENPETWEILVHIGPSEVPERGEDIIARLSREPFDEAEELII